MICKSCGASKFRGVYNYLINEYVLECEYCGTQEHVPYNKEPTPIYVPIYIPPTDDLNNTGSRRLYYSDSTTGDYIDPYSTSVSCTSVLTLC